jgi:sugar lactone lactonase YvrE
MKIKHIACALVFGAFALSVSAQQRGGLDPATLSEAQIAQTKLPAALYRLAGIYTPAGDWQRMGWALERLSELQPNVGEVKLSLATAYALQDDKTRAYDLLLAMQKQGYGYDLAGDTNFAKVADTKVWKYIVEGLQSNLKPFGEGRIAFSLPAGDTLIDSLAFDPKRKQFLAGSVREGKIYRVGKDGTLADFISPSADNGLWSVYAMAVDADDDALYVASTSSVYFKGFRQEDYGKAGVFKFRLSSGKLLGKYLLKPDRQPRTLSSITAGKGRVFAADGVRNIVYKLDGGALKPMVQNPHLTSVRGLALSGDGNTLYFADYAMGILGVDLAGGKGFDLTYDPAKLVLGGIDGLYWYDGTLVAIENGMSPRRVMRLTLGGDGRSVVRAMPLDAANPAFKLPTYGAIDGDGLYFIANSQKNKYDKFGSPKDDAKLEPVNVFRSDLRFAWNEGGIDMGAAAAPAKPAVVSESKPGGGAFSNVAGGSQSVTGD